MAAWLALLEVSALILLAFVLGLAASRRPVLHIVTAAASCAVIATVTAARRYPAFAFYAPLSWILDGKTEFFLLGASISAGFAALVPRLPRKRERVLVSAAAGLGVFHFAIVPFFLPILLRGYFENLETKLDPDGVCLQSNGYTCGPAAAVTALRKLGIKAEEGEIAIAARTTPLSGTDTRALCAALKEKWGPKGLECELRPFDSTEDLRGLYPTIVVFKLSFLLDHFVVVLDMKDDRILIADPLTGLRTLSRQEFTDRWRRLGIVLTKRKFHPKNPPASSE